MHNQNPTETSPSASGTEKTEDRRDPTIPVDSYPEKDDRRILTFSFLGYKIFVGRNALSNERLISEHKKIHKKCIWMHAHNAKGAHVVICINEKEQEIPEIVKRRAMDLALWYSVNREANKQVVWSELQDVYKPTAGVTGVWKTYKVNNVVNF